MSLAITEKRPQQQRPSGCVGILFQLFDWNRRLAKKKLFTKKFLPPARARKSPPKKSGGDDKMPVANKLLLIAEENRGGFPATKKSEADAVCSYPGNGTRTPGLVARLMGLESMPLVNRDKPRKALDAQNFDDRDTSCQYSRLDQDLCKDTNHTTGHRKPDSRPQKLQKTGGFLERRTARFSPEMLSKTVLSRSKRQHHKLASPVKSPRLLSRGTTAGLLQAATKILEPGLQPRNRARCALTYMDSSQDNAGQLDDASLSSKEPLGDSLVGSCRSCGNLMQVSEFRLGTREPLATEHGPSAPDYSNAASGASSSHSGSLEGKMTVPVTPKGHNRTASLANQAKLNAQGRARGFAERKHCAQNDRDKCKPWQDGTSKSTPRKNSFMKNQSPLVRNKVVHGTSVCSRKQSGGSPKELNWAKNFVASNINLNHCSRTRSVAKLSNSFRVETERNGLERNTACKRRPIAGHQIENAGALGSTFAKQSSVGSNSKGTGLINNRSVNRNCVSSELRKKVDGDSSSGSKDAGIVSFTFSSPMRHGSRSLAHQETEEKSRVPSKLTRDASYSKKLVLEAKTENLSSQRGTTLRGDDLGNLLEQKIKELTSLNREELAPEDALPARSTASILQELISALTVEAPIPQKNGDNCTGGSTPKENACHGCDDLSDCTISHNRMLAVDNKFKEGAKIGISASFLASDSDQPSPISILEASFSNDSCSFGSPTLSSGGKPHLSLTESCGKTRKFDLDNDFLDSATSANTREPDIEKIHHSIDKTTMHGSHLHEVGLSKAKRSHASEEAISNAELLLNISSCESDGTLEFSIDLFLLTILETIVDAFRISPKCSSRFAKEENQLREFLFDCIIECLDSKYSRFCKSGYKAWLKLPVFLSRDRLLREVCEEIRGWRDLAGKVLDVLIEKEISRSTLEWTEFEIEGFETGIAIENEIFQALVDEMVIDVCSC